MATAQTVRSFTCGIALLGLCAVALDATEPGDEAESSVAPPPAATVPVNAWLYKGVSASGYLDAYYSFNCNDPPSRISQDMALNTTSGRPSLNNATGSFQLAPAPFGFRMDAGYGRTYDAFYGSEPKHTAWSQYFLNVYVSYQVKEWKSLQLDFGKFVTSAGAEVTETYLNWNYSRSLLFAFGPFYHTGLRATLPLNSNWTFGTQVVTGWNLVRDNNIGKTIGITSSNTLARGKVTIANNYYAGPENNNTNAGWRNFYDLVINASESPRLSTYLNVDAGRNREPGGAAARFYGIAGAARYQIRRAFAVSPRLEYYCDCDGFWTGRAQHLKEFTLTGERKLNGSFLVRLEWRRDWSDKPFFQNGPKPAASERQSMVTLGLVVLFKPGVFKAGRE